jgi:hypothetical protein
MSKPKGFFKAGNKYSTGRPKDSLSKRSLRFADQLIEAGIDPVATLLEALSNAQDCYQNAGDLAAKAAFNGQIISIAEKMLPYVYPKLTSIEVKPNNPLDGMDPTQKLEAMKQAVKMLEGDVKDAE